MNQTTPTSISPDAEQNAAIIPNYASILTSKPPPGGTMLSISAACALIPSTAGILCFVLWLITSWTAFAVGGLFTIVIGTILFVVGFSLLLSHYILTVSRAIHPHNRWFPTRRQALTLLLLCINFPLAYALFCAADYIDRFYEITVTNSSPTQIDDLNMNFSTVGKLHVSAVPPGATIKRRVYYDSPSGGYTLTQNGAKTTGNWTATSNRSGRGDLQVTVHDAKIDVAPAPGGNARSHFNAGDGD